VRARVVTPTPAHRRHLVGLREPAVNAQARSAERTAAGEGDLDRRVRRAARRAQDLRGRVARRHTAAGDQQVRGPRAQREVDRDVGDRVDVVEQPSEASSAQPATGDGARVDRRGPAEGTVEAHATPTAPADRRFPSRTGIDASVAPWPLPPACIDARADRRG